MFNHVNNIGSTRMLTNPAGTVAEDMLFYPWGDAWQSTGGGGYNFAKLPIRDLTTNTDLTMARFSSPNFGRWFSPDPIGTKSVSLDDPQTWNMYAYVRNNPTHLTDPTGLFNCNPSGGDCEVMDGVLVDENNNTGKVERESKPEQQDEETPESLRDQIPSDVRAQMAEAIGRSNSPTEDDVNGGFHEESGVAGKNGSGGWVDSPDKPGPYANPDVDKEAHISRVPLDQKVANSIVEPKVFYHVHPGGVTPNGKGWRQPPSKDSDIPNAVKGKINIVFAAREGKVYFYNTSGVIGKPMNLANFLGR
jgi:RHS repeat-associated protein